MLQNTFTEYASMWLLWNIDGPLLLLLLLLWLLLFWLGHYAKSRKVEGLNADEVIAFFFKYI
jgi:hypothetical protein